MTFINLHNHVALVTFSLFVDNGHEGTLLILNILQELCTCELFDVLGIKWLVCNEEEVELLEHVEVGIRRIEVAGHLVRCLAVVVVILRKFQVQEVLVFFVLLQQALEVFVLIVVLYLETQHFSNLLVFVGLIALIDHLVVSFVLEKFKPRIEVFHERTELLGQSGEHGRIRLGPVFAVIPVNYLEVEDGLDQLVDVPSIFESYQPHFGFEFTLLLH
jgi:hypothetical protein